MIKCYKCQEYQVEANFYAKKGKKGRKAFDEYCKPCRRRRSLIYMNNHTAQTVARNRQWRQDNSERVKARDRVYYHSGYSKDWKIQNNHKRRARLAQVPSETIELSVLYERDEGVCKLCHTACELGDASIDHIQCIAHGGHHTWDNVQLAHLMCNVRRGTKPIFKGFREDE